MDHLLPAFIRCKAIENSGESVTSNPAAFRCHRRMFAIVLLVGWISLAHSGQLSSTPSKRTPRELNTHNKPVTYLALGDSTGLGLGARNGYGYVERLMSRIEKRHPGSQVVKVCSLGETATSLRRRISDGLTIKPTFVTLSIGINDILQGTSEEQFGADYEEIIKSLKRLAVPIVVTNLPSIASAPDLPDSMREEISVKVLLFNKRVEDLAERNDLLVVDLYRASRKQVVTPTRFFSSDGFHPSDEGYEYWTEIMWPKVKLAIKKANNNGRR